MRRPIPKPRGRIRDYVPTYTQADNVVRKIGGVLATSRLLGLDRIAVWRWSQPREKGGQDGLVPAKHLQRLLALARHEGILFTDDDLKIARRAGVR